MKVLFATYPMAFHTPGGGEIQLLAYEKHLPQHGVEVTLFDQWKPRFLEHDLVHFFSCVGGSVHLCHFVKQLGLPLVVSSSLWVTEETKHLYPCDEIRHQFLLADRVIANSEIECETLARTLDLPREKFVSVLNGVDNLFFDSVPSHRFRDTFNITGPFVLNVGNIEPRKNQLALIRAMKDA
jgi:glycosyltransferase involved in cell wall biosynthesis